MISKSETLFGQNWLKNDSHVNLAEYQVPHLNLSIKRQYYRTSVPQGHTIHDFNRTHCHDYIWTSWIISHPHALAELRELNVFSPEGMQDCDKPVGQIWIHDITENDLMLHLVGSAQVFVDALASLRIMADIDTQRCL